MKRLTIFLMIMFLSAGLNTGCGKKEADAKVPEAIPVRVKEIRPGDIAKIIDYIGTISGKDEAVVYPKVSGKIIEKVKDEGSQVNKGDVILYVDRDEVGLKFEKAPVESPLTGIVGRIYVDKGENVSPEKAVAYVTDMSGVKVELSIPEVYLPNLRLGQAASIKIDAFPEKKYSGRIVKISPVLDIDTRSAPIEIDIEDAAHELQSGMFAKVSLIIEERKNVPVVVKEAVIGRDPETFVYIIENNKAILRKVKIGLRQGQLCEISEGLKEGEKVVVMGQQRLRENTPVIVDSPEKG